MSTDITETIRFGCAYVLVWMGAALFLTTFVGIAVVIEMRPSVPDAQHKILWIAFHRDHYLTSSDTTMFCFALWAVVAVLAVPTYISVRTARFIGWNEADGRAERDHEQNEAGRRTEMRRPLRGRQLPR